jgi:transcription initiation factor IIE alpha subunit
MILKEDREYFTGNAINIIFTCPECGEVVTKVDECPSISDFGKNIDSDMINIDWDFVRQGHMNFGILKS